MRTHRCGACGFVIDRDWNAAINILELALRLRSGLTLSGVEALALRTVGHTGTHASGDIDLCLGGETPQGKPSRGKRKPKK